MSKARIVKSGIVAGLLAISFLAAATTASAATPMIPKATQSSCSAWIEDRPNWPLKDQYRVGATCTQIDPSVKVQGTADFPLQGDSHTAWFTDTNVTHYSEWKTTSFYAPTARVDYAAR